ncbi:MAG: AAA family ATPase [Verrucomicrobiaceae bacterium]|nr:AAA family ATPase [Verrucomicrobiaceae bacterium]NCF94362.1 AAA family ATPase [Verrucomicrobiaceae bacterium]
MRDQRDVVWDGTNIRAEGRSMIVQLARDYHAYTKLVVFATPLGQVRSRYRQRKDAIPTKVLASQIERF